LRRLETEKKKDENKKRVKKEERSLKTWDKLTLNLDLDLDLEMGGLDLGPKEEEEEARMIKLGRVKIQKVTPLHSWLT